MCRMRMSQRHSFNSTRLITSALSGLGIYRGSMWRLTIALNGVSSWHSRTVERRRLATQKEEGQSPRAGGHLTDLGCEGQNRPRMNDKVFRCKNVLRRLHVRRGCDPCDGRRTYGSTSNQSRSQHKPLGRQYRLPNNKLPYVNQVC